jgi:colanic acid/amylovoran biosynthesis protein
LGLRVLPRSVARAGDIYSSRHVDGVVDASGFFVGDQWHESSIRRDGETFAKLRRQGKPIVMLPQAFGPFSKEGVAAASRQLFSHANLILARDRESYDHVANLLDDDRKLGLCPDITIALEPSTGRADRSAKRIAIVPNVNIVARSKNRDDAHRYSSSLLAMYHELSTLGYEPFFLVHSSHGDPGVIDRIKEMDSAVRVVVPVNGLEAKILINNCVGTIAGRYHAIVSALSQGVPAVAHSWSHKYGALLGDFSVDAGLADPMQPDTSVALLDALIKNPEYVAAIGDAKPQLVATIDTTWERVLETLRDRGRR